MSVTRHKSVASPIGSVCDLAYLVSVLLSNILGKGCLVIVLALQLPDLVGVGVGKDDLLLESANLLSGINLALRSGRQRSVANSSGVLIRSQMYLDWNVNDGLNTDLLSTASSGNILSFGDDLDLPAALDKGLEDRDLRRDHLRCLVVVDLDID
jgi:hypothetical protein